MTDASACVFTCLARQARDGFKFIRVNDSTCSSFQVAVQQLSFLSPATFNVSRGQIASEVPHDFPRSVQRRPIPACHHFDCYLTHNSNTILYEQCSKGTLLRLGYVIFKDIIAAAVSEPEANERGSSLIGKNLHYRGIQSLFSHRCSALPIKLTSQLGAGR